MSSSNLYVGPWFWAYAMALKWNQAALETLKQMVPQANVPGGDELLEEKREAATDIETTIAHDLRTPLTSIRALSEILRDNPDLEADQICRFLEIIVQESEKLCKNVEQTLDLLELERNGTPAA